MEKRLKPVRIRNRAAPMGKVIRPGKVWKRLRELRSCGRRIEKKLEARSGSGSSMMKQSEKGRPPEIPRGPRKGGKCACEALKGGSALRIRGAKIAQGSGRREDELAPMFRVIEKLLNIFKTGKAPADEVAPANQEVPAAPEEAQVPAAGAHEAMEAAGMILETLPAQEVEDLDAAAAAPEMVIEPTEEVGKAPAASALEDALSELEAELEIVKADQIPERPREARELEARKEELLRRLRGTSEKGY